MYVHNQLVKYGEKIYIKGFQAEDMITDELKNEDEQRIVLTSQGQAQETIRDGASDDSDMEDMDPLRIIMHQFGNQYIILRIYGEVFISQRTLNKSINLMVRTRVFENYNEVTKCKDCHALVHRNLIPEKRFFEGINMKVWKCINPDCGYKNKITQSL